MIFVPNTISFEMVRGDTFELPIELNQGTLLDFIPYYPTESDQLYIGISQPHEPFEKSIIRKILNTNSDRDEKGNLVFKLDPSDTEHLMPGKYYISIKLLKDNKIETVLNEKLFFITGTNPIPTFKEIHENK